MSDEYLKIYKELRSAGCTPDEAIIKAHERIAFGA